MKRVHRRKEAPEMRFSRYRRPRGLIATTILAAGISMLGLLPGCTTSQASPPPPGGYFQLQPVGSYVRLPDDAAAAAEVHYSAWEPQPGNTKYNQVKPTDLRV